MCLLTLRYLLLVYLNYLKYEIARRSLKGNAQSYFIYGILISCMVWQSDGSRVVGLIDILSLILIELIVNLPFPVIAVALFLPFP